MADNRVDPYSVYHAKTRRPDPVRRTMASADHLNLAQFSGQVKKGMDRAAAPGNQLSWYGMGELKETR